MKIKSLLIPLFITVMVAGCASYTYHDCPLCLASHNGDANQVREMLNNEANPNAENRARLTALHAATTEGHTEIVEMLLAAGANPNSMDAEGHAVLWWAVEFERVGAVRALLAAGADPNLRSKNATSPISRAYFWRHEDIIRLLVAAGAPSLLPSQLEEIDKKRRKQIEYWQARQKIRRDLYELNRKLDDLRQ